MKKITLTENNTFEHVWFTNVHGDSVPDTAIDVTDDVFMLISQNTNKTYDPDTGTISDYVAPFSFSASYQKKYNEIVSGRDSALTDEAATVIAEGATWQVDPKAMRELNDALTLSTALGAAPVGLEWRDADNVNHSATLQLLLAIASARAVQKDAIWKHSWQLKSDLAALDSETATQTDIDAIIVDYTA